MAGQWCYGTPTKARLACHSSYSSAVWFDGVVDGDCSRDIYSLHLSKLHSSGQAKVSLGSITNCSKKYANETASFPFLSSYINTLRFPMKQ